MDMNTARLKQELHAVIGDAEELLCGGMFTAAVLRVRDAAHELNGRVHDNPWTAVGIAAGVGVIAGLILARK